MTKFTRTVVEWYRCGYLLMRYSEEGGGECPEAALTASYGDLKATLKVRITNRRENDPLQVLLKEIVLRLKPGWLRLCEFDSGRLVVRPVDEGIVENGFDGGIPTET